MNKTVALVVVDVQNDFCTGGPLAVPGGEEIIPNLNSLLLASFKVKVLSQDYHPPDHCSFYTQHSGSKPFTSLCLPSKEKLLIWPPHCVQGTPGSEFHPTLETTLADKIIQKGTLREVETYSAFGHSKEDTELLAYLQSQKITQVVVGGLALDYCVIETALDAKKAGFDTTIIIDGTAGVNSETSQFAIQRAKEAGIDLVPAYYYFL